jgi:bifunctional non-homologous end joining protein LigD
MLLLQPELSMARTIPFRIRPMLATLVPEPFTRPNWIFEEKYDGVRILAYKERAKVALISRNAIDRTARYPEIAAAIEKLAAETILLDGEIVVFDRKGVSRFQLLQQGKGKPEYAVFDCLYRNGEDLRRKSLRQRRTVLEEFVKDDSPLLLADRLEADGLKAFASASRRGLEGILAKEESSLYISGRSKSWLKVKVHQEEEFVIGGFTPPTGSRSNFGALLLGAYEGSRLIYAGKVGTGFTEETLRSLYARMRKLATRESPFAEDVRERNATFLFPKLVAQIAFTERTDDGKLRHPVFLGLRDDKTAREVTMEGPFTRGIAGKSRKRIVDG